MDYFLFLLLNATLFLRPTDVIPSLSNLPIYNAVILVCLAVSLGQVMRQLSTRSLVEQPISACVAGLLIAVLLSHLSHGNFRWALSTGTEFGKVVLYYALLVGVLSSSRRLIRFLDWLCVFTAIMSVLAILEYNAYLDAYAKARNDGTVEVYLATDTKQVNGTSATDTEQVNGMIDLCGSCPWQRE